MIWRKKSILLLYLSHLFPFFFNVTHNITKPISKSKATTIQVKRCIFIIKRKRKSIKKKCGKKISHNQIKSSKPQASKKSKNTSSSSNEVYSILESSLRRKANKQTVLTSSDDKESILFQSLKRSTSKKTKFNNRSPAKGNKYKKSI